jgi:hypothetical protein
MKEGLLHLAGGPLSMFTIAELLLPKRVGSWYYAA